MTQQIWTFRIETIHLGPKYFPHCRIEISTLNLDAANVI